MKLKQMAMANAFGALGAVYFIVCYVIALFGPGLYKVIFESWFHMVDVSSLWKSGPDGLVLGLVSFTVVSWISGWLLAYAYNIFAKE